MEKPKKTILFIDNNQDFLNSAVGYLQDQGNFPEISYDVITATDENEAAKKIQQHKGDLVVVVPNNLTEENSGIELIESLKKQSPKTPFVLVKLGHESDAQQVEKLLESKKLDVPYVEDGSEELVEAIKQGFKKLENKIILVVDDDIDVRVSLKMFLAVVFSENYGYQVMEASGANTAKAICDKQGGNLFVLTDNDMPDSNDGIELIKSLRRDYPQIQVALMSGRGEDEVKEALSRNYLSDVEFYKKPIQLQDLTVYIKQEFEELTAYNKNKTEVPPRP